jgi:hypothetical protein
MTGAALYRLGPRVGSELRESATISLTLATELAARPETFTSDEEHSGAADRPESRAALHQGAAMDVVAEHNRAYERTAKK